MRATDLAREFLYTATRGTALVAFLTFFLLLELATVERLTGLWLLAVVIPALIRYLMLLLDARGRDRDSQPPGIEIFSWFGSAWSLVPLIHLLVLIYATYLLASLFGAWAAYVFLVPFVLILPASLAVLTISRTPIESVRPGAIAKLIRRAGPGYLITPMFIGIAVVFVFVLHQTALPTFLTELAMLYLVFAGFAITGGLIRPLGLYAEVAIPPAVEPDVDKARAALESERMTTLSHGYGLVSRGNRAGGLRHISDWLEQDPEPATAWPWFVEQMLGWESADAGLLLAQRYLGRLLREGDSIGAVKLMSRCRLVNEAFKPLAEDHALALAAAEQCQHEELVAFLE